MDGWMDNECIQYMHDRWKGGFMDGWIDSITNGWMDGWKNYSMINGMDGWMDA